VADYVAGVEVIELARRYGIARQTVPEQMRREGDPRRHPRLSGQSALWMAMGTSLQMPIMRSGISWVANGRAATFVKGAS